MVGDASELRVTFWNGQQAAAEIVGVDPKTDIAVIKVPQDDLRPAPLGDSDLVEVGEWSLAIGSPMELQQSVTAGIISAVGRNAMGITDYEDFLQTDAAINPGNSGGPLVNLAGEVIGINTAIASKSGGYMGIGFAIPSNMVRVVADSLIAHGQVHRGQLGAIIQDLTEELAATFHYDSTRGVLVSDVVDNGPAAEAGLQPGDIVTRFNGKPVVNKSQLRNMAAATAPGTRADLTILRDGKTRSIAVNMGQLSEPTRDDSRQLLADSRPTVELTQEQLGVGVSELTQPLAERLDVPPSLSGVVVTSIRRNGVAARLGMRPGDLITEVGGQRVKSPQQLQTALAQADLAQGVRLRIAQRTPAGYLGRFLLLRR